MNGKSLHRVPDLDQVEWVYADSVTAGATDGSVYVAPTSNRITVVRSGGAKTISNVVISTEANVFPGKRIVVYANAGAGADVEAYKRGTPKIGTVTLDSPTDIRSISIKGRKGLSSCTISNKSIKSLDITNSPVLSYLSVAYCRKIQSLSTAGCKSLTFLQLANLDSLSSFFLDTTARKTIQQIFLYDLPNLKSFDFSGMVSLNALGLTNTQFAAIDLSDTSVTNLNLYNGNAATYLKAGPSTETVTVAGNATLQTLDLSLCSNVRYINASNSGLTSVTIPNGYDGGQYDKASISFSNCQLGAAALVSFLNSLGTYTGNYKNFIDISNNPGSYDGSVNNAVAGASTRGWYIYTGLS